MSQVILYPLRFDPIYQYRLWGGRRLAGLLAAPLPNDGPIGEAWILSDREDHPSKVANGPLKEHTIGQVMAQSREQLMGRLAQHFLRFPLLLKFLDAREMLSVQVHPGYKHAGVLPAGMTAKSEAWVVLEAGKESRIYALRRAGIVHDIGKICVPEQVLVKAGPLTAEEWTIMKQHPVAGERICSPLKSFRFLLPIIRHHHEKLDGSGYPDGLKGDEIPLTARVLQVVDIYDALTTDRPYRKAMRSENAFAVMREEIKRGWWDGSLVEEFEALVVNNELNLEQ